MTEVLHAKAQTNKHTSERKLKKRKRENGDLEPTNNNLETTFSKEEWREAKRSKKLKKEIWADAKSEEHVPASDRLDEEDKAAAKSARKAEKARLKATKRAAKEGSNGTVLQEELLAVNC